VSAASGSSTSANPSAASRPASSSESTSFRAHPRVSNATDNGSEPAEAGGSVLVMTTRQYVVRRVGSCCHHTRTESALLVTAHAPSRLYLSPHTHRVGSCAQEPTRRGTPANFCRLGASRVQTSADS